MGTTFLVLHRKGKGTELAIFSRHRGPPAAKFAGDTPAVGEGIKAVGLTVLSRGNGSAQKEDSRAKKHGKKLKEKLKKRSKRFSELASEFFSMVAADQQDKIQNEPFAFAR